MAPHKEQQQHRAHDTALPSATPPESKDKPSKQCKGHQMFN